MAVLILIVVRVVRMHCQVSAPAVLGLYIKFVFRHPVTLSNKRVVLLVSNLVTGYRINGGYDHAKYSFRATQPTLRSGVGDLNKSIDAICGPARWPAPFRASKFRRYKR